LYFILRNAIQRGWRQPASTARPVPELHDAAYRTSQEGPRNVQRLEGNYPPDADGFLGPAGKIPKLPIRLPDLFNESEWQRINECDYW
jgi:hypothetical protein